MASVNETVRECISSYPMLEGTRTGVLQYLLCVIGNGFYWHKGEVVTDEVTKPWSPERAHAQYDDGWAVNLSDAGKVIYANLRDEEIAECTEIISQLDERVHEWTDLTEEPYPQTDSALLMNMPDDVTDDWREACERMRAMLVPYGWKF